MVFEKVKNWDIRYFISAPKSKETKSRQADEVFKQLMNNQSWLLIRHFGP